MVLSFDETKGPKQYETEEYKEEFDFKADPDYDY